MRNLRKHIGMISAVAPAVVALSLSVGCSNGQTETWPTTYEPDVVQGESDSSLFTVEPFTGKELATIEPSFND